MRLNKRFPNSASSGNNFFFAWILGQKLHWRLHHIVHTNNQMESLKNNFWTAILPIDSSRYGNKYLRLPLPVYRLLVI